MTSFRHILTSVLLGSLVASVACGGETLIGGSIAPVTDDAGTNSPPHTTSGGGSSPVVEDAGTAGALDAGPFSPPLADAEVSPEIDAASVSACMSNADCLPGSTCLWPVSEDVCLAFNPAGTCMPNGPLCGMVDKEAAGCGCDGQTVTWGFGCNGISAGYAPVGIAHLGACADAAAPDAATTPPETPDASAPAPCGPEGECPMGYECGYGIGDCVGPSACLPSLWFSQPCNSATVLCGCNGMSVLGGCDARAASVPTVGIGSCPGDAGF